MSGWPDIQIDNDCYPTEESITRLESADIADGAWLVEELPRIAEEMGYCSCIVTDTVNSLGEPCTRVDFSTGGWSGAEDLIGAVLSNMMLRMMFYEQWRRGGHYRFEIPRRGLGKDNV